MAESSNCQICGTNRSKYSCPQCLVNYCSVSCYQSESHLQCSENFYELWVHEEMKNCQSNSEAKKKMLKILKENEETNSDKSLDSDDDEDEVDLAVRIQNVDLDDEEALWEKLTFKEKQEFKKLVATGNIVKIMPDWEPWWKTKKRKFLIQDCSEHFDWRSICPNVPLNIPALKELTKTKPSPNVPFMLVNILISYVFTVRWFKGAHRDMPVEGISMCIALSGTLRCNNVYTNYIDAFVAFVNDFSKCEWLKKDTYSKIVIQEDLIDLIKDSNPDDIFYCLKAAVCDLNELCLQALCVLKENNTNHLKRFSGPPPRLIHLQQLSKKMTYYLSWIVDYGTSLIQIL